MPRQKYLKESFSLIKDYFVNSDEKLSAWGLLLGTTVCVIGASVLMLVISYFSSVFMAALIAKTLIPFLVSSLELACSITAIVSVLALQKYLGGMLALRWGTWLKDYVIKKYFGTHQKYLEITRLSSGIDNIHQRIQEDTPNVASLTLELGLGLLSSIITLGLFAGSLWMIGGTLAFAVLGLNIIIPGYLVWAALGVAIFSTIFTSLIGRPLIKKTILGEKLNANHRSNLEHIHRNAESIAAEQAEGYYSDKLRTETQNILRNESEKLTIQSKLLAFQTLISNISAFIPDLCSTPLYFAGIIDMAQLTQIGMAFGEVSRALNFFVTSFESITTYGATIERVLGLREVIDRQPTNLTTITRTAQAQETITLVNLRINYPTLSTPSLSNPPYMMRSINVNFTPRQHTVIKGRSGLGKSTLFKVISGTWPYGDGTVTVPHGQKIYYLPQNPNIPENVTLMEILAFPQAIGTYSEEAYIAALNAVNMGKLASKLQEQKTNWSGILSGGEKQRVAFARAMLKQPSWLLLDEASSAIDEENEPIVYKAITNLSNTTVVSIAHKRTVDQYHARVLFFQAKSQEDPEISIEETINPTAEIRTGT